MLSSSHFVVPSEVRKALKNTDPLPTSVAKAVSAAFELATNAAAVFACAELPFAATQAVPFQYFQGPVLLRPRL
jgi:hypothetical protein